MTYDNSLGYELELDKSSLVAWSHVYSDSEEISESKRGLSFECDLKFIISHSVNAGLDIILANRPVAHFPARI